MRLRGAGVTFTFGVPAPVHERVTVSSGDPAAFAAAALPGVPDPVEPVAPQLSTRLLDSYGAYRDSVKGHAA